MRWCRFAIYAMSYCKWFSPSFAAISRRYDSKKCKFIAKVNKFCGYKNKFQLLCIFVQILGLIISYAIFMQGNCISVGS